MKWLIWVFPGFLVLPPAHAASFDCAKASTSVEHIICSAPDISRLDEEMAAAYQTGLASAHDAETFKREQKTWIRQRNNCLDANCVRGAYRTRLRQMRPAGGTSALSATAGGGDRTAPEKYPPYPDVWDWVLPNRGKISALGVSLVALSTGDILVSYGLDESNGEHKDIQPFALFGRHKVIDQNATAKILSHALTEVHFEDGQVAEIESEKEAFDYLINGIPLADGRKLVENTFQQVGPEYASCYRGPARVTYSIIAPSGKLIRSVVIFRILPKPKRIDIENECMSEGAQSFTTRVESVDSGMNVRPLADGGFVMQMAQGVLMRFDKDFTSCSSLVGDKVFVLDVTANESGNAAQNARDVDDWIYIDRITGKTYRKGPQYPYDYQSVVNDLFKYLNTIKSAAKKECKK